MRSRSRLSTSSAAGGRSSGWSVSSGEEYDVWGDTGGDYNEPNYEGSDDDWYYEEPSGGDDYYEEPSGGGRLLRGALGRG